MKNLNIITLGCSKNLVDSEHLAARCEAAGWRVVFDGEVNAAATVVINTCGFIGDAKQESVDMILELAEAKKRGEIERLYVIGCLSERYGDELRAEIPEVDAFFGARSLDDIAAELCAQPSSLRKISTPAHYAYLKISEGCDRRCGFCAIPLIRGKHVSVPPEVLISEARSLAAQGVKELIVIAQDITLWGLDIYGERRLAKLLKALAQIEGIEWIRLHYGYPAGFPDDVVELMAAEPKICKYLDIPLQHIAEGQLRSMKRGLGGEATRQFIGELRARVPDLALRTTMLVGYPNETEEDFCELLEFVRQTRFERLGVFAYSPEEGTYAGDNLADNIPDDVKQSRVERLMELQARISAELNAVRVGTTMRVVVDRREGDFWVCRSQWDSPEVDGEVLLPCAENIREGQFIDVLIAETAGGYDLLAQMI